MQRTITAIICMSRAVRICMSRAVRICMSRAVRICVVTGGCIDNVRGCGRLWKVVEGCGRLWLCSNSWETSSRGVQADLG